VRTGNQRVGRELVGRVELDVASAAGDRVETAGEDGDIRFGLVLEQAQLGGAVRVERSVSVEMVGLEVQQHTDARPKAVHVLELEARQLADDPRVVADRAVERADGTADVARDRDRPPGRAEDRAEQLARGRLAVRSGDAEEGVAQEAEAELDLAPDRYAAFAGGRRQGRLSRHAGALHEQVDSLQQPVLLRPQVDFDTGLGKPPGVESLGPVDGDGRHASARERQRGGLAGAREAEHECAARQLHGRRTRSSSARAAAAGGAPTTSSTLASGSGSTSAQPMK
jgi:hypothetical protein